MNWMYDHLGLVMAGSLLLMLAVGYLDYSVVADDE